MSLTVLDPGLQRRALVLAATSSCLLFWCLHFGGRPWGLCCPQVGKETAEGQEAPWQGAWGLQALLHADISFLGLSLPVAAPELTQEPSCLAWDRRSTAAANLPAKDAGTGRFPGDCPHPPGRANRPAESLQLLLGLRCKDLR